MGAFGLFVNTEVFPVSSLLAIRFGVSGTGTAVRWMHHRSDLVAAVQGRADVMTQEPAHVLERLERLAALRV